MISEPITYTVSDPQNEWFPFKITVDKDIVIWKSLNAPIEVGASLTALKNSGWGDSTKYKIIKDGSTTDGESE